MKVVKLSDKKESRNCIEALEEALKMAKNGEVSGFGLALIMHDHEVYTDFGTDVPMQYCFLVGAIEKLKSRAIKETES